MKSHDKKVAVISSRAMVEHVGWRPIYEFEDIISDETGATIHSPRSRISLPKGLRRVRRELIGTTYLKQQPEAGDLLIVVALTPGELDNVRSVKNWRSSFRRVVGFVVDSFATHLFPKITSKFDAIFVPIPESVAPIASKFNVATIVLPFGADTRRWGNYQGPRSIDIINVGRCPSDVRSAFQRRFHSSKLPHLFLHSPIGAIYGGDIWLERAMLMKTLQRSRLAIAYDLLIEPSPLRPISMPVVLPRYFESLAAGCVVIGRSPATPFLREMFPWEDAFIELPIHPDKAVDATLELLEQHERLAAASNRNRIECQNRHDWRMRVAHLLSESLKIELSLPIPPKSALDVTMTVRSKQNV